MKQIGHFVSGLAVATCFPDAVSAALGHHSYAIVLGGIFGGLPDFLDFKFYRFMEHTHHEVDPHPEEPDPQGIAETVAGAVREAYETAKPVRVKLHTIRLSGDKWRRYGIRFDNERQEVVVRFGPVVTTSQVPYPGSEPEGLPEGRARLACKLRQTYDEETKVDIFSGPSFTFRDLRDGMLDSVMIEWHRGWSHSLPMAAVCGLLVGLLGGWMLGLMVALCYGVHIAEDHLGHMGSNLFWPFTRRRFEGFHMMRSADAFPNFLCCWLAVLVILYNLNRFRPEPMFDTGPVWFFLWTFAVPALVLYGWMVWSRRRKDRPKATASELAVRERLGEVEELVES